MSAMEQKAHQARLPRNMLERGPKLLRPMCARELPSIPMRRCTEAAMGFRDDKRHTCTRTGNSRARSPRAPRRHTIEHTIAHRRHISLPMQFLGLPREQKQENKLLFTRIDFCARKLTWAVVFSMEILENNVFCMFSSNRCYVNFYW